MNLEPLTRGYAHCTADVNDRPVILVLYHMMDEDFTLLVTNNYVVRMLLMVFSAHALEIENYGDEIGGE